MADYTLYRSDPELEEALDDVEATLQDLKLSQERNLEQRTILAEQVQGSMAIFEKEVTDYETQRDQLDREADDLAKQLKEFEQAREQLQQQAEAKREAILGRFSTSRNEQPTVESPAVPAPIITKAGVEKLEESLDKPKPELTPKGPDGRSQTDQLNRDLKSMMAKNQRETLTQTAQEMNKNWEQTKDSDIER